MHFVQHVQNVHQRDPFSRVNTWRSAQFEVPTLRHPARLVCSDKWRKAAMMSEEEQAHLRSRIAEALNVDHLSGWEMGFLDKINERLNKFGERTKISEKERYRLDQTFDKLGLYPNPRMWPRGG